MYNGSRSDEDPKDSLNEVYKILFSMGITIGEKSKFAAYQLKYVVQIGYTQWTTNRGPRGGPVTWEIFKRAFLDRFFTR